MTKKARGTVEEDKELYKYIGKKIVEARSSCNRNLIAPNPFKKLPNKFVTQTQLSKPLNVTFQQIQKYENAKNKIPLDKLIKVAIFLKKPLYFFLPTEALNNLETLIDASIEKENNINQEVKNDICTG